ncbi:hypothetical protein CEE55_06395 [Stenotrophomonas pavanii]|uniref:Uncharacterized protein n=1 Tax=Stenotrophomonas pavanii TaxID=487698 RepID=A0A246L0P2_9GAMM|nr:hypothetical protein CEE55_06395 [Stenotrophomonas pavanii]
MTMAMAMAMAMAKASLCANQDKAAIVCGMQLQKNIPAILVEHGPADRLPAESTIDLGKSKHGRMRVLAWYSAPPRFQQGRA